MSGEDKNKLDELFRKGLESPDREPGFAEGDWNDLKALLDGDKKRRGGAILPLWPYLSGVAALLLLALGWWFFTTGKPAADNNNNLAGAKHPVVKSNSTANIPQGTDTVAAQTKPGSEQNNSAPQQTEQKVLPQQPTAPVLAGASHVQRHPQRVDAVNGSKSSVGGQQGSQPASGNQANIHNNLMAGATQPSVSNIKQQAPAVQSSGTDNNVVSNNPANANPVNTNPVQSNIMAGNVIADNVQTTNATQASQPDKQQANVAQQPEQKTKPKVKKTAVNSFFAKPQFAISILGSPDINGVKSFSQSRVGTNIGMLFSVSFGKLSISTGAAYSKKPYETSAADYHAAYKFKVDPSDIYADCRVLDIPLNVDYRFYRKNRNSFSVGTGLSSYIMLSERYTYTYDTPYAGPAGYAITNRNQHILGVLNLNTTYQRQINSKFSVGVQPYLKIPLTNIGAGQVRLQSAGVAVGFSWNISPSKTP
ncbi:hypothetical protein C8P68_106350 [Mucilaginibacter yixingensis]|uniref:Outer membrane protein with beta-barrel domain n=1 Tax=Mucilaginibacter yixingensis TaxID=1295612 RepID=A0A2T5J7L0_9SPHI|nr:hypothetical protein [Mucilaginibacter yixingensis]PTQ95135.1 hypothetical protein C8P68_106350 [Mucilaginibacter yixingensis]